MIKTNYMTDEQIRKMICHAYWLADEGSDLFDRFIDEYRYLKAISKLAVNALEKVQDRYAGEYGGHICETEMRSIAKNTISEIESRISVINSN